ncbi:serine hydroxymethyltransferase [Anaeramoeba flamelloides]|uniref:Serine hydroxymethyltransferase n=1 Tax=Anaeramoeba flamelloides TaxID=1746091 RepID=A0AAV7YEK0_9EUKA|nr:serine hydroxymethyltransferase [Anaeramoeba flamelloides]
MSGLKPLKEVDEEIYELIQQEKKRQVFGIELIASENFVSKAVLESVGSCLTNKYSEGQVGHRYYGGNEVIDKIEKICIDRALKCFKLDPEEWGVNVQPYSGSPANFAVYTALLKPHDRFMGLDLPSGGHLTHGYHTLSKKVSATSHFFESFPYRVNNKGLIDYDELEKDAVRFYPKIIVCGASAYPRDWDYERLRKIADKCRAWLMCDMAHISGLIAKEEQNNPFEYCDIVTTTTHKTLRGPRSGMIFFKKNVEKKTQSNKLKQYNLQQRIDFAIFPQLQGGPHNNVIAAVAVALKEVMSDDFKKYVIQVRKNVKALAEKMQELGYKFVTNGSDNHLLLWDLKPQKLTGSKMQRVFDKVSITVNMNTLHGDRSALSPSGIRLGTPAMTTRGLVEKDFEQVAIFIDRTIKISLKIQEKSGRKLRDFIKQLDKPNEELEELKKDVEEFASQFPMPGFDKNEVIEKN